jgi:copper homeostasis protein
LDFIQQTDRDIFKSIFTRKIMPLEIACFNVESALLAAEAGADRIELCAGASVGGTTPAFHNLQAVKAKVHIPVNVMIRPRGGNFTYSQDELAQMREDIQRFKPLADGFVFGILDSENGVDRKLNNELVELAAPKPCTFHRAFDEVPDLPEAASVIMECRFAAILTSGGRPNAVAGATAIAEVIKQTKAALDILVGGGVRSSNIDELKKATQANWFHSSAITSAPTEVASAEEVRYLKQKLS